jgi:uncharacterized membrane protein YfcA
VSEKGDRLRWAAFWFSVVLAIIGGIIGAIGGSWLVVALALLLLASSAWRLATTRRTRPDR